MLVYFIYMHILECDWKLYLTHNTFLAVILDFISLFNSVLNIRSKNEYDFNWSKNLLGSYVRMKFTCVN